jgi:hypothetical protein
LVFGKVSEYSLYCQTVSVVDAATAVPYARGVSEAALLGCMDLQCSCRRRASARVEHEVAR